MKSYAIRSAVLCGLLFLLLGTLRAEEQKTTRTTARQLVGTWKLVSAKYGGQKSDLPERLKMLKQVTPTHFLWTRIDSKTGLIIAAAGGPFIIDGSNYTETPEFGIGRDFETIRDKPHTFTWEIEGDRWHHTGELANGLAIEEIWERVAKEN